MTQRTRDVKARRRSTWGPKVSVKTNSRKFGGQGREWGAKGREREKGWCGRWGRVGWEFRRERENQEDNMSHMGWSGEKGKVGKGNCKGIKKRWKIHPHTFFFFTSFFHKFLTISFLCPAITPTHLSLLQLGVCMETSHTLSENSCRDARSAASVWPMEKWIASSGVPSLTCGKLVSCDVLVAGRCFKLYFFACGTLLLNHVRSSSYDWPL